MDSSSIELAGSEIESISLVGGRLEIRFSRAIIIKTMTGSVEKTKWSQAGSLIIGAARVQGALPRGALVCDGGDLEENVYTYRDMIPIPLESRGAIRCELRFRGIDEHLVAEGETVELALQDVPKYIEHIRS